VSWLILLKAVRPEMADEPTEEESRIVEEHFQHLTREHEAGRVRSAALSAVPGDPIGLVVVAVEAEDEARALMESDPAIVGGIMTGELRPYHVAIG
jgi:uncharacterized protein YciI